MKPNRKPRYLLPDEHPGGIASNRGAHESVHRFRTALVVLTGIPLAAYFWRGLHAGDWGWSLVGLVISVGFAFMLWRALVTGYARNNHGSFPRATRPLGYWLSVLVLVLCYLLGVGGLLLADLAHRSR